MVERLLPSDFGPALSQLVVLASVGDWRGDQGEIHKALVLQALDQLSEPALPEEIKAWLGHHLEIHLTLEAVLSAASDLISQHLVAQGPHQRLFLPTEASQHLTSVAHLTQERRQQVMQDWLITVQNSLAADNLEPLTGFEETQLTTDLEVFLLQLVRHNAAEVVHFLYPGEGQTRDALSIDEKTLFRELPARSEQLERLRRELFPAFVREAKGQRAEFIVDLLHRSLILQLLRVDAEAGALFAEAIREKYIFLDTNFVFRALGLQGQQLKETTLEVLELGRKLGHTFHVSERTFQELQHLVEKQTHWLTSKPDLPRELSEVAAENIAGNDFISAYWRERARAGVDVAHYLERHRNLALLLENLFITISSAHHAEISGSGELSRTILGLRTFKPHESDPVVEHDAFNKVLVEKLRTESLGRQPNGWYETTHIFLTFDNVLPAFSARMAHLGKGHKISFCVMTSEWLQMYYLIRSDVEIQPETLLRLLNSPYLQGYFWRKAVDRDLIRQIILTISDVGEMRPEIARKLLADRILIRALESTQDAEHRQRMILKAVEAERTAVADRLQEALKERDRAIEELKWKGKAAELDHEDRTARVVERMRRELAMKEEERQSLALALTENKAIGDDLADQVQELRQQKLESSRREKSHQRLLLLLPALLVILGLTRIISTGDFLGWLLAAVGVAPIVVGVWRRFSGVPWVWVSRVANLLTILFLSWEYFMSEAQRKAILHLVRGFF